jgi:hypothetical protein
VNILTMAAAATAATAAMAMAMAFHGSYYLWTTACMRRACSQKSIEYLMFDVLGSTGVDSLI